MVARSNRVLEAACCRASSSPHIRVGAIELSDQQRDLPKFPGIVSSYPYPLTDALEEK